MERQIERTQISPKTLFLIPFRSQPCLEHEFIALLLRKKNLTDLPPGIMGTLNFLLTLNYFTELQNVRG